MHPEDRFSNAALIQNEVNMCMLFVDILKITFNINKGSGSTGR